MQRYPADNFVIDPGSSIDPNVVVAVTPADAGWDTIHFQARRLRAGQERSCETGSYECALILLDGVVDVISSRGRWNGMGGQCAESGGAGRSRLCVGEVFLSRS